MEQAQERLLMAFYGDDFTGSTDALEFLCRAGIKTVLFIAPPSAAQLEKYEGIRAIGVAGMSRSLSPSAMEETLVPTFQTLKALKPKHVHYKVCSTFDSSPKVGSIGKAIEIGASIFETKTIPLVVAAPILGRYCFFGNLFARMGIGSEGQIFRLDRHPSMRKHPTTPADESDLRLHLAKQTDKQIGLVDLFALRAYAASKQALSFDGKDVVLFDAIEQNDLETVGEVIETWTTEGETLFSVGSSAIEMALGAHWKTSGAEGALEPPEWPEFENTAPILVLSGSCSPITAEQITYAITSGFDQIAIDTIQLAEQLDGDIVTDEDTIAQMADHYANLVTTAIRSGKNSIVHTSTGNDDFRVSKTDEIFQTKGFQKSDTARIYGSLLGLIAKKAAGQASFKRIVVAGGDTSSYAARAMNIEAVEMIAPFSPGAPLCIAHATHSSTHELQLIFKGGQVGKPDFFVKASSNI